MTAPLEMLPERATTEQELTGRVALVTGGSSPIGRAVATRLARLGVKVLVGYREGVAAAREVQEACPNSDIVRLDVTEANAVTELFDQLDRDLGGVDILVNGAGINRDRPLPLMRGDDWDAVLDTDLSAVFRCTQRALRSMLRSRWGRVISIGSVSGVLGAPGQANYAAAKAGLVGFTRSVAREFAPYGITANVVAPGLVEGGMTARMPVRVRDRVTDLVPMGRLGRPEEIAEAVAFCVRCAYLTGQNVVVDGGLS